MNKPLILQCTKPSGENRYTYSLFKVRRKYIAQISNSAGSLIQYVEFKDANKAFQFLEEVLNEL